MTHLGLLHAAERRERARSKANRDVHLHNVLVRFAYNHSPAGGSVKLQLFAADDGRWFAGSEVT